MDPNSLLGKSVSDFLVYCKNNFSVIDYTKIDVDEFVKLPEQGIYFQALNGDLINGYRIYYQNLNEYSIAGEGLKGQYVDLHYIDDAQPILGEAHRNIPSVRIPGVAPTYPGREFICDNLIVSIYYKGDDQSITFINVKLKS